MTDPDIPWLRTDVPGNVTKIGRQERLRFAPESSQQYRHQNPPTPGHQGPQPGSCKRIMLIELDHFGPDCRQAAEQERQGEQPHDHPHRHDSGRYFATKRVAKQQGTEPLGKVPPIGVGGQISPIELEEIGALPLLALVIRVSRSGCGDPP